MSKRITALQKRTDPRMSDVLPTERDGDFEAQGLTIQQLVDIFNANSASGASGFTAITSTVLPNITDKSSAFALVGSGTYTQTTGGSVTTTEALNILGWSGTTWVLVKAIPVNILSEVQLSVAENSRESGAVNATTGALVSSTNSFRTKVDLQNVVMFEYPAVASGVNNGTAFYKADGTFISGVTYTTAMLSTGTRVKIPVPAGAAYAWYTYPLDAYAVTTNVPKFTYFTLSVQFQYLNRLISSIKTESSDQIKKISDTVDAIAAIRFDIPDSGRLDSGTVNAVTGGLVSSNDLFRYRIDLGNVDAVEFPAFSSISNNGIGFYKYDGTFVSGVTYVTGTITPGDRKKVTKPVGADYLLYSYYRNDYADRLLAPRFSYIRLFVNLNYVYSNTTKTETTIKSQFQLWKAASLPYGNLLNLSLADKTLAFESILNNYPGTTVKTNIGKDQSGTYDMFAYTVTPARYTTSVAITAHVHGAEKITPTGVMAMLAEMSKPSCNDPFLCYLRDNVRWFIVFVVNPWGYVNASRTNSRNVNLNRNNDYRWVLNTTDEADRKGSAPASEQETKNVMAFFATHKDEIAFHLDCHDVSSTEYPYAPANNKLFAYQSQMNATREALEKMNETPTATLVPYINEMGSFGNFFNENLGITSVTLESAVEYWGSRKYSNDIIVAKSAEMVAAFLCMWFNLKQNYGGQMFFERDMITAFKSEELGINTWAWSKFHAELVKLSDWTQATLFADGSAPVYSYSNSVASPSKTIMIIAGEHDDDKNSSFTAMRLMQEISKSKVLGTYSYLQRLHDNIKVVVIPALNPNLTVIDWSASSNIKTQLQSAVAAINPDYIVYLDGAKDLDAVGKIVARKTTDSFTTWTKANTLTSVTPSVGIETAINKDRITFKLSNVVPESSRYGFAVVQWLKAAVNDMASYTKG